MWTESKQRVFHLSFNHICLILVVILPILRITFHYNYGNAITVTGMRS